MKICRACNGSFEGSDWTCPQCGYKPEGTSTFTCLMHKTEQGTGFEEKFFDNLSPHEEGNFWFINRNRLIQWVISEYFPGARSMFEIGCGTGYVLSGLERAFPNLTLQGSEFFEAGLSVAAGRLHRTKLYQMDARAIPFDKEFDIVGAFDVLEHIEEDKQVLKEMRRAVKPGGGIIITVPQHPWLWSACDDYGRHVRRYTAGELRRKVEEAGFTIKRLTSFVSILLPLMLLARSRKAKTGFNPTSELTIPAWQNSALDFLLSLEQAAIRKGLNLPIGGSLLLVGHFAS